MEEKLTLIYNNPDPGSGGIPRYAHRIKEGIKEKSIDFSEVDFSELSRETAFDKVRNLFYRRKLFVRRKRSKLGSKNHFLQPELYFSTEGRDIVTMHDVYLATDWVAESPYEMVKKKIFSRRVQRAIDKADCLIAVSEQTKSSLIEMGAREEKIEVINSGVREKFKKNKDFADRDEVIGYLGDFNDRKRVGKMLEDFSSSDLKRFDLKIGGSGGQNESNVRKEYSEHKTIDFLGKVPEKELVNFYNSLKALFVPSEKEGFGLPILEAAACGTPVFIYEDANISPEIQEYCHKVSSIDGIDEFIADLEEEDLGNRAKKVKDEFSWERTLRETKRVYNER